MRRYPLPATMMSIAIALFPAVASSTGPAASAQEGKQHFIRCAACHSTNAADRSTTGPHLNGIVGRAAASLPHFAYASELRGQDFKWSPARLDAFLESPRTTHPGMCPTFNGLAKAEHRAALIAYLQQPAD